LGQLRLWHQKNTIRAVILSSLRTTPARAAEKRSDHLADEKSGLAAFESIAPLLLSAVQRHISLQPEPCDPSQILTLTSIRQAFELHRPDLTTRELDVVSRAVLGMSYEGIATDLGLKLPTVKTYRNRAFDRMQISFRSELVRYYLSIASTPHSVSMR
jgi:DNA-binding CsgD family transcriptional regulator